MTASYEENLEWLYRTQLFGIKLGLENVTKLIKWLGLPAALQGRKILHVAGTNGKGSVCAFSDQILRDAGLTVGLFTSPHLISFTERIKVNEVPADPAGLAEKLAKIRAELANWNPHPTFFEITFALALLHFCESDCGVIILETGMGGRLDATNALKADVSVITQISFDHQQWLGTTLREIAAEKAGIIKPTVPVIVAEVHPEARDVIGRRALALGVPYIEVHPLPEDWKLGLAGPHQRENAALAVEACCRLAGDALNEEGIRHSLAVTFWPGRFQRINEWLIVDGAHNEAAARVLVLTWREVFGETEQATLIFGVVQTKDVVGILTHLGPLAKRVILVPVKSERRRAAEEMAQDLRQAGFESLETVMGQNLAGALSLAKSFPEKTLVAGSLYLVGETLSLFEKGNPNFEVSLQ